jgi:hypothetical protein
VRVLEEQLELRSTIPAGDRSAPHPLRALRTHRAVNIFQAAEDFDLGELSREAVAALEAAIRGCHL